MSDLHASALIIHSRDQKPDNAHGRAPQDKAWTCQVCSRLVFSMSHIFISNLLGSVPIPPLYTVRTELYVNATLHASSRKPTRFNANFATVLTIKINFTERPKRRGCKWDLSNVPAQSAEMSRNCSGVQAATSHLSPQHGRSASAPSLG